MYCERFTDYYAAKKFAEKVNGQIVSESQASMGLWDSAPLFYYVYYDD